MTTNLQLGKLYFCWYNILVYPTMETADLAGSRGEPLFGGLPAAGAVGRILNCKVHSIQLNTPFMIVELRSMDHDTRHKHTIAQVLSGEVVGSLVF